MAVSVAGFKTRFARYCTVEDATVSLYLDIAGRRFDATKFTDTELADDAQYYLAAHLYSLEVSGPDGQATSKRVGDIAVTYKSGSNDGVESTYYGRQFLEIVQTLGCTPGVL